jgi:hypothetical protein
MNKVILLLLLVPILFSASLAEVTTEPPVVSYSIEATLMPESKSVSGSEKLVWTNMGSSATQELFFHLYLNAFKNSHSTYMREAANRAGGLPDYYSALVNDGWGYCDVTSVTAASPGNFAITNFTPVFVQPDDNNADDESVFKLELPAPIAPGESVNLSIDFISKMPHKAPRTGYHQNYYFVGQWFPKIGVWMDGQWNCHQFHSTTEFFADFSDYDVNITVPAEYVVGAAGVMIDSTLQGDTKTLKFQAKNIHDFAWTAYPGYKVANRIFEHPDLPSVNMRLLYQPEHKKQVDAFFDATANTLKHFGLWYIPYPYSQITIVDAGWRSHTGGMEYPTLFTTGADYLIAKGEQSPQGLTVHECGHQIFYALLGSNEFEHAWMDEGIDTYAASRCMSTAYGPGSFTKSYLERSGFGVPVTFKNAPMGQRDWIVENHRSRGTRDYMNKFSWDYVDRLAYRNNAYEKPALMMWTLENYLGESVFNKIMKTYSERFIFKHPKPQDFIDVVNEFASENMDWFFEKMLHEAGVVDYAVSKIESSSPEAKNGYFGHGEFIELIQKEDAEEDVFMSQVHVQRLGPIAFPVELLVTFENGDTVEKKWDGEAPYRIFYFENKSKIEKAEVDPYHKIWLDVNYANNGRYRQSSSFVAYRWGAAWLFWLQHLLETVALFS